MEELLSKIESNWNNKEELQKILLEIHRLYDQTAETLGIAVQEYASAIINERDNSFKTSIAETEYRIKSQVGSQAEVLRYRLENISLTYKTVSQRVGELGIKKI